MDHLTVAAGVPAPPFVPVSLLELLARHDPARAEQVQRLRDEPPPDAVLVLGPAEQAVGQLAAALAARVPARLRCAPVEVSDRHARIAETRAVVWVFDAAASAPEAHWARLAALAGQVDEVHLALAGTERGRGGGAALAAVRARLAEELPRLAAAPVHLLAEGPGRLMAALVRPADYPGYRNALRVLETGLVEALGRRLTRQRNAARREIATGEALGRNRDELAGLHREAIGEWPRRFRNDLAELRGRTSLELTGALRILRDDAREQLNHADRAARARFPEQFGSAAGELARRVSEQIEDLYEITGQPVDGAPPGEHAARTGPPVPSIAPPVRSSRSVLEDRLMLVVGASGGLGLGRLAMSSLVEVTSVLGASAMPVAVGLGVGAAWWLARARRAVTERARLAQWVGGVLDELRIGLEAMVTERALAAERRLGGAVSRAVDERVAVLSARLREHERLARRAAVRRAELRSADNRSTDELRAAGAELVRLLAVPVPMPVPVPVAVPAAVPLAEPELAG
ncbi:MAG TPA: hypothetical protein VGH72_06545 [Pseudonocardia sp.]